jgi:TRAP-type C4-dicarboxylate transport system permease small subunit
VVALYYSFETVHVSAKFGSVTDGLRISRVWFLMAVPVGFALVLLRLFQSILRDVADLRAGRPVYEGDKLFD